MIRNPKTAHAEGRDLRSDHIFGTDRAPRPNRPEMWTLEELDAFAAKHRQRGAPYWSDIAWQRMLERRAWIIQFAVDHPHHEFRQLPAAILPELSEEQLATARCPQAPWLAISGAGFYQAMDRLANTGRAAPRGRHQAGRIRSWLEKQSRWAGIDAQNARLWIPGLSVQVIQGTIRIDSVGFPPIRIVPGPATQRHLRQALLWWRRCLRALLPFSLSLLIPSAGLRASGDTLRYGVIIRECDLAWIETGPVDLYKVEPLATPITLETARRRAALEFQRWAFTQPVSVRKAIDQIVHRASRDATILGNELVSPLAASAPKPVHPSDLDDAQRTMIRPLYQGKPVSWDEPADSYAVHTDGTCGPEHLLTVPRLNSAVALESSNRIEVTMRLRLGVAA
jgi:hypothetical protein